MSMIPTSNPTRPHHPPLRSSTLPHSLLRNENIAHYLVVSDVPRDHSRDKALLIAAQDFPDASTLSTPYSDQDALYKDLRRKGFKQSNICCLRGDDPDPEKRPTKANILRELVRAPVNIEPGDLFVLHLAGHAVQVDCTTGSEQDGKDEAYVAIDQPQPNTRNNLILDNVIRRLLVNSLPGGSFLIAILDTCSSGTLLDLDSPTKYEPRPWPVGKDPESPTLPSPLPSPPPRYETLMQVLSPQQSRQNSMSMNSNPSTPLAALGSPIMFRRSQSPDPPDRRQFAQVLSISACQDGEQTWSRDKTMVTHLLRLINKHNGKQYDLLTPKMLEQKLNKKMTKSRMKDLQLHIKNTGRTWTNDLDAKVRNMQSPKITTLPGCTDLLDKPFTMLTPAPRAPVTRASY